MIILIAGIIGGILYRFGGIGGTWWKNTKVRDIGVPLVSLFLLYILSHTFVWWVYGLTFLLMFGSMTTYCKIGKQKDVFLLNWILLGLLYGITPIFFSWHTHSWVGFFVRLFVVGVTIPCWSCAIDSPKWEEGGRGFLFTASIPLLLL